MEMFENGKIDILIKEIYAILNSSKEDIIKTKKEETKEVSEELLKRFEDANNNFKTNIINLQSKFDAEIKTISEKNTGDINKIFDQKGGKKIKETVKENINKILKEIENIYISVQNNISEESVILFENNLTTALQAIKDIYINCLTDYYKGLTDNLKTILEEVKNSETNNEIDEGEKKLIIRDIKYEIDNLIKQNNKLFNNENGMNFTSIQLDNKELYNKLRNIKEVLITNREKVKKAADEEAAKKKKREETNDALAAAAANKAVEEAKKEAKKQQLKKEGEDKLKLEKKIQEVAAEEKKAAAKVAAEAAEAAKVAAYICILHLLLVRVYGLLLR
jgi:hypothetical protein